MNAIKEIILYIWSLLKMAFICACVSAVLSLIYLPFNKEKGFWIPFVGGAVGLFALWWLLSTIRAIKTLIRFKKDPNFKRAYFSTGIEWEDFKRLKNDGYDL